LKRGLSVQSKARDRSVARAVLPTAFQSKFGERQGGQVFPILKSNQVGIVITLWGDSGAVFWCGMHGTKAE